MKNSELLAKPYQGLNQVDRQRHIVLRLLTTQMPCPNCAALQSPLEAHGIALDDYDTGISLPDGATCIACKRGLQYTVPLVSLGNSWHWTLVPVPVEK